MGQRLIKQTVLMDGSLPVYHLYYGNADAEVGSIATTFPYARRSGRAGSGQVAATSYAVPRGTLAFWAGHFDRLAVAHSGIEERFGTASIRVRHPAGLLLEVVDTTGNGRRPWTTREISADVATRGFSGVVLSVRDVREQQSFSSKRSGW